MKAYGRRPWEHGIDPDRCPLCGTGFDRESTRRTRRAACWDHCHDCGEFRGWLCAHCNTAEGFAQPGRVSVYVPKKFRRLLGDSGWRLRLTEYYMAHECKRPRVPADQVQARIEAPSVCKVYDKDGRLTGVFDPKKRWITPGRRSHHDLRTRHQLDRMEQEASVKCDWCRRELPDNGFCPHCGSRKVGGSVHMTELNELTR